MNTGPTVFETEEWRPIPEHPGYEVSSLGRVRSHVSQRAKRTGSPVIIGESYKTNGYKCVSLRDASGNRKIERTHRLVAAAFHVRKPGQDLVRHLDDDRTNCRADNLAWGDEADNHLDAIFNGKVKRGQDHHGAFISDEHVREIFLSTDTTYAAAAKYGVSPSYISNIRTRSVRQDATADLGLAPGAVGMGGYHRGRGRKITREQAIEIFTNPASHTEIARRIGVSIPHIIRIRQGIKWRSVTEGLSQPVYGKSTAGIRVNADGSLTGRSITGEQAIEIFMSPERGRDIAQRMGISEALVSTIRKRGQWGQLTKGLTPPQRPNYRKHRSQDLAPFGV